MNKRNYSILLVITLIYSFKFLEGSPVTNSNNGNKLNVLFIAVDDLKPNISCFGDSLAITPEIDALAKKGMVFTKNYCQQAVCAPSRASLLTSRYPDQTEVWDLETLIRDKNPDIVTLPQYFKLNGYNTMGVGKIFDSRSVDSKKDEVSWNKYGNPYQNKLYDQSTGKPSYYYALPEAKDTIALLQAEADELGVDKRNYVSKHYWPPTECADVPYNSYVDGAIANEGVNLLDQLGSAQKPFFLAVGFQRPHLPFNAPKQFWDYYNRENFNIAKFQDKSENGPDIAYHNFGELRGYTGIPSSGNLAEEKQLELIHAYYASISYIDYLVGLLSKKLNELGLAENTIIVLWGDHGWHLGDHNLWCKHSNFEQATRSPLLISYPNQPNQGFTYDHPTEFTDITTTLCKLCELDVPVDFEGENLLHAIENPQFKIREGALSQYPRSQSGKKYMGYSLRTDRYRYTKWVNRETKEHFEAELYDYDRDPLEKVNQAENPEFTVIVAKLDSIVGSRISIPSTQEHVSFQIKNINSNGDTIGSNKTRIEFAGKTVVTNYTGENTYTHLPGTYDFSIEKKGFKKINSQVQIKTDTTISFLLEKEYYKVNIIVKADWNERVMENVKVRLANSTEITDSTGMSFFNGVEYDNYHIETVLPDGWKQTFYNTEIFSDTTLTLKVAQPTNNILVHVENLYNQKDIAQTKIILNGTELTTNTLGNVLFTIPDGMYELKIIHDKYFKINDTVTFQQDTTFDYKLIPSFSDIKFRLKESTTPVNMAIVAIDTIQKESTNLGISRFKNLETFKNYHYLITKPSYQNIIGELWLINDTTIEIQMEKLSTLSGITEDEGFTFWPNPAYKKLHLKNHYDKKHTLFIQNSEGKTLREFELNNNETRTIDISRFTSGLYFIKESTKNDIKTYKLLIK